MPISQNLRFTATVPKDSELEHPAGTLLMRRLSAELTTSGWGVGELDNWRDSGWFVVCRRGLSELTVVLSWVDRGYWMLQVRPRRRPALIGRLVGGRPSATPADVHELALAVHYALSTLQYLGSPHWRWDGFPDEKHSKPEPQVA